MSAIADSVGTVRLLLAERPRLAWREELVTVILGTWMLAGLHLDGWAHQNLTVLDTIWTPWHAVFYSGAIALMIWIVWHVWRLAAIPEGYGLGLVGVGLFFLAGISDQIWHLSLGIERDLAAFLSPSHMGLAVAILLMVSSPLRAGWSSRESEYPGFVAFFPVLLSLTLTIDFLGFLFNYVMMFASDLPHIASAAFRASFPADVSSSLLTVSGGSVGPVQDPAVIFTERFRIQGIISLQLTSLILLAPTLMALRRWRLPFGSLTFVYLTIATAVDAIYEMNRGWTLVAAAVAGLVSDLYIRRWDPSPRNVTAYRIFAGVMPFVLWLTYFVVYAIAYGIGWAAEFWAGSIVIAVIVGVLLSVLTAPQALPSGDRDRVPVRTA